MDNNINPEMFENNGTVNISDEVVSVIASLAASEVEGVVSMSGGVAVGFAELLGMKNMSKGVKITKDENGIKIDLSIIVEYGAKIPGVAWGVQDKVKSEVESMTGIEVAVVNVSVDAVNIPTDVPKAEKEEKVEKVEKAAEVTEETEKEAE